MFVFYLLLFFFVFIGLFILYHLSRNDFILMRKNISVTKLFNYAFIHFIFGYISARIIFILDSQQYYYFNPLLFFHFVNYPGVPFFAFVVSSVLIYYLLIRNKEAYLRVLDMVFLSMIPLYIFQILSLTYFYIAFKIILILVSIILLFYLISLTKNYTVKDGSISLILLILFSCYFFALSFFDSEGPRIYLFTLLQYLTISTFFISLTLLIINEKLFISKLYRAPKRV